MPHIRLHAAFSRCENLNCPAQGVGIGWCFNLNWLTHQQEKEFKRLQAAQGYEWVKSADKSHCRFHSMDSHRLYFCPCKSRRNQEELEKSIKKKLKQHSPKSPNPKINVNVKSLLDLDLPNTFIKNVLKTLDEIGVKLALDICRGGFITVLDEDHKPVEEICMKQVWLQI